MVLDKYVCQMAYEGDIGAVKAWLAADPSRDVTDLSFWEGETHSTSNHSSLLTFAAAGRPSEAKCVLIRWLLEQGVPVPLRRTGGDTAVFGRGGCGLGTGGRGGVYVVRGSSARKAGRLENDSTPRGVYPRVRSQLER